MLLHAGKVGEADIKELTSVSLMNLSTSEESLNM